MANRTLGNDISHRKIHQNGVLWLFREEKMTILLNFLKNAHFRTKNNHFLTPKTEKKLFMANRTLGNDISHGKIHQNEVLWLFREEKLTILLNFLKKCNFWQQKQFFLTLKHFFHGNLPISPF